MLCCLIPVILILQGCATTTTPPFDYGAYVQHMPASILVIPPRNESVEVMAPYIYLSTITRPLAERGYYVFPVAVIEKLMKENGIIEMLVAALVNQILSAYVDPSRDISQMASNQLFTNQKNGLLLGKRHNQFEADQRQCRERMNQAIATEKSP